MAGYDDELRVLLETLNKNFSRTFGGSIDSRSTGSTGSNRFGPVATGFNKAAGTMRDSMKLLHGTTDDLAYHFKNLMKYVVGGELFSFVIDAGRHLTASFNKMTDVGQYLNGSMLEMAKQAGDAGLSLDEYTKMITRNSTASAILAQEGIKTSAGMGTLQKAVRDVTKEHGFYGMTLSQVSETTSDTMETLRQTGQLMNLNEEGRKLAVVQMIQDASAFSATTGKSREEIMKSANTAMRDTAFAFKSSFLSPEVEKSFATFLTGLSSIPGDAGDIMAKGLSENFGMGGSMWTQMGKDFRDVGLQSVNELDDSMARRAASGEKISQQDELDYAQQKAALIRGAKFQLELALRDPSRSAAARAAMAQAVAMNGVIDRIQGQINKPFDAITEAAATFESNFHEIIGRFQSGLYGALVNAFAPKGETDPAKLRESFNKTIDDLKNDACSLGKSIGGLAASVGKAVEWWLWFWKQMGVGAGWGALITAGLYKIMKTAASWYFQKTIINAGVAELRAGHLAGGGGGAGGVGGKRRPSRWSPPASPGLASGSALLAGSEAEFDEHIKSTGKATMSQRMRRYGGLGGSIGGALIGIAASMALDKVMDSVMGSEDSVTKEVAEAGLDVAVTAGLSAVGGMIGRSVTKMIAVRMAEGVAAEAAAGGLEIAAGGALAAVAWPAVIVGAAVAAITYAFYKNKQNNQEIYDTAKKLGLQKKGGEGWFDRIPTFDDPTTGKNLDYLTTQKRTNLFKENTEGKNAEQLDLKLKELTDEKEADQKKLADEGEAGKKDTDLQEKIAMLLMEIKDIGCAQLGLHKDGNDVQKAAANKQSFADVNCR